MLDINRILFPTDFSAVAEDAFSHAAHLAMRYDAEVYVFNVVTPQEAHEMNPMEYLPLEEADGRPGMFYMPAEDVDVKTPADEQGRVRVTYGQIESVSPAHAIIEQAKEDEVDLIVMGTHGRRGFDRLLSGSVSEEVVREAPCPVFTVLAGDEPTPGPYVDHVLAPVDLSEQSTIVADHAAELAATYDARLTLMHVVEQAAYPTVYGVDPLTPELPNVEARAREALDELAERVQPRVLDVETVTTTGYAARDIVDYVDENDVGLIVMATHGRTGLKRFVIGSVAEKVVRTAPCPVFTLRSFGRNLLLEPAGEGADEAT
ncbi:universal stress protein [Longibacter salinarum]|uniref:Universal stress protein n=1 Tax=Longibacter salinarum TaxID=1850348 RepID=A0A2A8CXH2_9BACT|nr:universal stress protein [Longibacter salinarum]PEN13439.1 universal stress protein [Longibacter salinarum]